jgi:hypothetical protein
VSIHGFSIYFRNYGTLGSITITAVLRTAYPSPKARVSELSTNIKGEQSLGDFSQRGDRKFIAQLSVAGLARRNELLEIAAVTW